MMSVEDNKALVQRFLEWWMSGDVSILDETVATDIVAHASGGQVFSGRDAVKKRLAGHISVFNERQLTIADIFGEGDRIAARYDWSGVMHNGRTGNITNQAIYRIADGLIAEEWEELDTKGLAEQTSMP
jgi:ketosteroid isomerase-like protein